MITPEPADQLNTDSFAYNIKTRSDNVMNYFLIGLFLAGLLLATFYDTWLIGCGVGGLSLFAYYICKISLPESDLYQYVLGVVLGIFTAQFIYQMHGMFEMHFFAFIGSAILITYQNWKLQIPLMLVVVIHHATFSYLQNTGVDNIYFTQLEYLDLQTFIIHVLLAALIFFICGLWSHQLKKFNEKYIHQSLEMALLQQEAIINQERKQSAQALENAFIKAEKAKIEAELANAEAEQAHQDLERKKKELEQFAYIASHDLQEPLRTTSSFVGLIQKQYHGQLDEKADKYFKYILDASERMKVLIKNLLEYSRIGSKKELETVDCNVVLKNVIADLHVAIQESKAVINYKNLPVLKGYATELKQLFQNLLINAIKFRKKDAIPQIDILVHSAKNSWEFQFKDNGIGIEKQHREKIFNIFQRLHSHTEYEGSGIGLSYCKKIVELHHGKIWVESTPGAGSNFHFSIYEKAKSSAPEKARQEVLA